MTIYFKITLSKYPKIKILRSNFIRRILGWQSIMFQFPTKHSSLMLVYYYHFSFYFFIDFWKINFSVYNKEVIIDIIYTRFRYSSVNFSLNYSPVSSSIWNALFSTSQCKKIIPTLLNVFISWQISVKLIIDVTRLHIGGFLIYPRI